MQPGPEAPLPPVRARLEAALEQHRQGALEAALAGYAAVLELAPDEADAWRLQGAALRRLGRLDAAETALRRAVELAPAAFEAWLSLGHLACDRHRLEEALAAYERAAALDPASVEAALAQATALKRLGRAQPAVRLLAPLARLHPTRQDVRHDLATATMEAGERALAAAMLQDLLAEAPELAEAHYNLGLALMAMGDWPAGFAHYEWRWGVRNFPCPRRHGQLQRWAGGPFAGRHLLIHAEQGLGDTLQFTSLLPQVRKLGGQVTLEVQAPLVDLLRGIEGADRVIAQAATPAGPDLEIPLMSLPLALGLSPAGLPAAPPSLGSEPARQAFWRQQLDRRPGQRLLGLNWRGNPTAPVERGRSLAEPGLLAPLAGLPGVRLIGLQAPETVSLEPDPGPTGWRLGGLPFRVEHPGPGLDAGKAAFLDTAALLASLDAVVTTDTALAHLAGRLGRPTWLMLRHAADWRWLEARADTPWYPTMRLLRQPVPGDWASLIDRLVAALRPLIESELPCAA